jgi:hypothetical protein
MSFFQKLCKKMTEFHIIFFSNLPAPISAITFEEKCQNGLSQSVIETPNGRRHSETSSEQDSDELDHQKPSIEQQRSQSQPPESPTTIMATGEECQKKVPSAGGEDQQRIDRL